MPSPVHASKRMVSQMVANHAWERTGIRVEPRLSLGGCSLPTGLRCGPTTVCCLLRTVLASRLVGMTSTVSASAQPSVLCVEQAPVVELLHLGCRFGGDSR